MIKKLTEKHEINAETKRLKQELNAMKNELKHLKTVYSETKLVCNPNSSYSLLCQKIHRHVIDKLRKELFDFENNNRGSVGYTHKIAFAVWDLIFKIDEEESKFYQLIQLSEEI